MTFNFFFSTLASDLETLSPWVQMTGSVPRGSFSTLMDPCWGYVSDRISFPPRRGVWESRFNLHCPMVFNTYLSLTFQIKVIIVLFSRKKQRTTSSLPLPESLMMSSALLTLPIIVSSGETSSTSNLSSASSTWSWMISVCHLRFDTPTKTEVHFWTYRTLTDIQREWTELLLAKLNL